MSTLILPAALQSSYDLYHFAPARRHNGMLYFSGQIGVQPDGSVPDTAEAEFRNAWTNIDLVLTEAGLGFSNLIEITSYHVDLNTHIDTFTQVKDEFIKPPYPAWTAIGVSGFAIPGARAEITIVASDR
ncbi:MAG: RidA family protein [Gammaproteobacteria bacterium]|nr:RidA family protein [Gammaproteobacteria bacterium]